MKNNTTIFKNETDPCVCGYGNISKMCSLKNSL